MRTRIIFLTSLFLISGIVVQPPRAVSKSGTHPATLANIAAPLPDLKIISVSISENKAIVRIKNIGKAPSIYCNLKVSFLQGENADSGVAQSWNYPVPALAINRDIALTVTVKTKPFSGNGCLVTVDTQNDVAESNESNNQYFTHAPQSFQVVADLAAIDIQVTDKQVIGTVKNVGGIQSTGMRRAKLIRIVRYGQHQKIDELATETLPSLKPGQTFTMKAPTPPDFPDASKYTWILRIDNGDVNPGNDKIEKAWTKFDDNN